MRLSVPLLLAAGTLAFAACGDDEQATGGQATTDQAATQRTQAPATEPDRATPQEDRGLVAQSQQVLSDLTEVGRRLAENPQADVEAELQRIEQRARALAEQARAETQVSEERARDLAEQGEEALAQPENAELRERLADVNEQAAETAERLRRITDPQVARDVIERDIGKAGDDLAAVADELSERLPPAVRDRVDELRDRVSELAG